MNEDLLINLVLAGIYAFQAGMERDAIIDAVRQKKAEGATAETISAYLQKLADDRLAELNKVELSNT